MNRNQMLTLLAAVALAVGIGAVVGLMKSEPKQQVANLEQPSQTLIGHVQIADSKLNRLHGTGAISICHCEIGNFSGSGEGDVTNSKFDDVHFDGLFKAKDGRFTNRVEVNGVFQADQSKFERELSVCSDQVRLTDCQVKNIKFAKNRTTDGEEMLILRKTVVSGSVTFEGGRGTVWLDAGSKISGGVHGGKVKTLV